MEASQVQRLQEEQHSAIQTTNDEIDKWKKLNSEYKNLSNRLLTLPNKITHEVMVPFGPMAFMPGQLVHTNEILVLLGDNWFVERSAKEASQISKRRMKAIEKQLEDLQLQKNLLVNRTSFTDEIHQLSGGSGDIKEINEKYDEEKEEQWRVQHKENVKKYHQELQRKKLENPEPAPKKDIDDSIWERLDELEILEAEQDELNADDTTADSKPYQEDNHPPTSAAQSPTQGKKTVRWFDEVTEDSDQTDSSDSDEDTLNGSGTGNRGNLGVIHFTHSSVEPRLTEFTEEKPKETEGHLIINSPTDIYKYFVKKSQSPPKSILKSPSFEGKLPQEDNSRFPVNIEQKSSFYKEKAFTEEVVETAVHQNTAPASEDTVSQQPKKNVQIQGFSLAKMIVEAKF